MAVVTVKGQLVDILQRKISPCEIVISDQYIRSIKPYQPKHGETLPYIMPGFVDSHVHIESSMLIPSQFARLAVVHGTVATVSDPHEIANVCGFRGVEFMIEDGKRVPFKFYFGAPSCVPATTFETAGAEVSVNEVEQLLSRPEIKYLSEMMNFPGVLNKDPDVLKKIAAAQKHSKPIDGHAPGLRGDMMRAYVQSGMSTDHECFSREEALEKLQADMKILIREGSAARNFDALIDLLNHYPDMIMFCSDDKHPDSLVEGHINTLCSRAIARGVDVFSVLRAACVNPVLHYKLEVGLLKEGDSADFILVDNLTDFVPLATYVNGVCVAENGASKISIPASSASYPNQFEAVEISPSDLLMQADTYDTLPVIEALEGQLITNKSSKSALNINGELYANLEDDVVKIVVVNRYRKAPVAKAFITNFGMRSGAIASSVAHDSHNIVAVGSSDEDICAAVNLVISSRGGISCVSKGKQEVISLPVAGLMSAEDGYEVARAYTKIDRFAHETGCTLASPFMTLSFMALLVIPHLKLSDLGLFDGDTFSFVKREQ